MAKGILPAIRDFFFGSQSKGGHQLRATYDIAQTTPDNANQWAGATGQDADAANSPGVRQLARNRSRHETQNNPTLTGIVRTITHYEVGTGPTLHVESDDEAYADEVEKRWREWCEAVMLTSKLRQMVYGRVVDGESFARLDKNPGIANEVKLDFVPFEPDRCYTLWLPYMTPNRVDGVWFDNWGNPTFYDVLHYHPGGVFPMPTWKFDSVPAQYVLHLFSPERANQHRGIPEMLSSTDLWADRRRHRKATVAAAESAANVAAFLTTNQPAMDGDDAPSGQMSMPRNSLVVAPDGYDMKQIDAKHPNQTYESFSLCTLSEAARPMSMAKNVAACDSSSYNFAGGRLDIITSWKAVEVNQHNNTQRVVSRLFRAWYAEARVIYGWQKDHDETPAYQFFWVGMPYSDPEAEQNADEAAIKTGLKGIQEVYARRGKDWKVQQKLNARALGMTVPEYLKFMLSNLETGKGGDQGGGQQEDTPGQVKAMFTALAARLNGHGRRRLRATTDANNQPHDAKGLFSAKSEAANKVSEEADKSGISEHHASAAKAHGEAHELAEYGSSEQQHHLEQKIYHERQERKKLVENRKFLEGKPVVSLNGNELRTFSPTPEGRKDQVQYVAEWFVKHYEGHVTSPDLGEVDLDANGVERSLRHGTGTEKDAAFAAVPAIIANGKVLDWGPAKKAKKMTVFTIGAPVQFKGEHYVGIAIVRKDPNQRRFFLHEVFATKVLQTTRQGGAGPDEPGERPHAKSGAINSLLRKIFAVKGENK